MPQAYDWWERRLMRSLGVSPDTQACINCNYFILHYQRHGAPFQFGHCTYPRRKDRKAVDVCGKFERRK